TPRVKKVLQLAAREARSLGWSTAHLRRVFRTVTGHPPTDFLIRERLRRAAGLLRGGDEPVAAVAAAVGMQDPSYFSRLFKRQEGLSPAAYRTAYRRPD
ncbi:MAG: helix-turn-helix transcriptional regulator, partial [Planctomycetota bacterium]